MIPYRLDLAGGWLDQPYISGLNPGYVITLSLEPIKEYKERCGMATSTRKSIKDLYKLGIPDRDSIEMAKLVFNYDNKPGAKDISGAQDAIGICMKGLTRHRYDGRYWPEVIETCQNETVLQWLEDHIFLELLWPRPQGLDILKKTNIESDLVYCLNEASEKCWYSILRMDLNGFASALTYSYEMQKKMFPLMTNDTIENELKKYSCMGLKLAGAGGGGYIIMVNDEPCGERIKVRI
jgi:galactokinase/mevalonate kinase-like predicted kinase